MHHLGSPAQGPDGQRLVPPAPLGDVPDRHRLAIEAAKYPPPRELALINSPILIPYGHPEPQVVDLRLAI